MKIPSLALTHFVLIFLLSLDVAKADSYTWQVPSGDWDVPANWGGVVPTSADTVLMTSGTAFVPAAASAQYRSFSTDGAPGSPSTVNVTGGLVSGTSAIFGLGGSNQGTLNVSSGTWNTVSTLTLGYVGKGTLTVDGGLVSNLQTVLGSTANGIGEATIMSGTLQSSYLDIGSSGTGTLTLNAGRLSTSDAYIGSQNGSTGSVTVESGIWSSTYDLYVGSQGTGSLYIKGGLVTSSFVSIGASASGNGSVVVSGGTWNSGSMHVGVHGSGNTMTIEDGGTVSTTDGFVGTGNSFIDAYSDNNVSTVTGNGSLWRLSGNLTIGSYGSNNALIIDGGALVEVGGALAFSALGASSDNYLRLNEGYIALFGDQTAAVASMIADGNLQLWNGSSWVTSTDVNDFDFGYFASDAAAETFSGYQNLGNHTILTAQAVPEPSAALLVALGVLPFLRRIRNLRS